MASSEPSPMAVAMSRAYNAFSVHSFLTTVHVDSDPNHIVVQSAELVRQRGWGKKVPDVHAQSFQFPGQSWQPIPYVLDMHQELLNALGLPKLDMSSVNETISGEGSGNSNQPGLPDNLLQVLLPVVSVKPFWEYCAQLAQKSNTMVYVLSVKLDTSKNKNNGTVLVGSVGSPNTRLEKAIYIQTLGRLDGAGSVSWVMKHLNEPHFYRHQHNAANHPHGEVEYMDYDIMKRLQRLKEAGACRTNPNPQHAHHSH
eukprot:2707926-Rhodomonas_salina.1